MSSAGRPWLTDRGRAGRRADVGVSGGTIAGLAAPGSLQGRQSIDAAGLVVAPGFIDPHTHLDAMLLADPAFEAGLRQGVTTVVLGSDGCGYAPATDETLAFMRTSIAGFSGNPADIGWDWRTLPEYMARFDAGRVAPNSAFLLPYGCLRHNAMGLADRLPSPTEAAAISAAARAGMADGAVGFSWGYHYPPNTFATTDDLIEMGRAVAPHGVFSSHMRDYEHEIAASLGEVFAVGRATGIRVHVSHLNMHWEQGLPPIEAARADGVDATFDTYPYLAGSTVLTRHLPGWALAGGTEPTLARLADPAVRERLRPWLESPDRRWDSMLLGSIAADADQDLQGRPPLEAAALRGQSMTDFVCDLLIASRLEVGIIGFRHHRQNEDDLRRFLADPHHVVASDGIFTGANPHPRGYGAFARVLGRYVRDERLLPLADAIRRMTSSTARIFGLGMRGRIALGAPADLAVFDPTVIADRATYERGREPAVGVQHVLVNGIPAVLHARLTGDLAGQVIRGAAASNAPRNVAMERAQA